MFLCFHSTIIVWFCVFVQTFALIWQSVA